MSNVGVMGRILVVLLLLGAGLGVLAAPVAAEEALQVAVLRFQPREPDLEHAWLGPGLGQLLSGALGRRDGVVAIDREHVADLIRERDLRARGLIAADEAGGLTRVAGADWGVVGSYAVDGETVDVDLTVVEAGTGTALRSARLEGRLDDLGRLVARLVQAVFGAKGVEPAAQIPPVPVEAFRAYARALAADERGDYARVFVELSQALRQEPSFSLAELELGRLYHRLGEPEHAVVTFRRVVDTAVDVEHVAAAALAGADVLKRDLGDLDGASRLLERVLDRFPYHEDVHLYAGRIAAYRADGGDVAGAFTFLDRMIARLAARQARLLPDGYPPISGPTARARNAHLMARHGALRVAVMHFAAIRHALAARHADALPPGVTLPEHWFRLDRDQASFRWEHDELKPHPGVLESGGSLTFLAQPGLRFSSFELTFHARKTVAEGSGRISWYEYGCNTDVGLRPYVLDVASEDEKLVERIRLPVPAPRFSLHFYAENAVFDALELRATFVDDGPELGPWPPPPADSVPVGADVPGTVQHAHFTEEENGRLHLVFAAGPRAGAMPGYGAVADAFDEADLWVTTREAGADAFGPPRRLQVSTLDGEYHPSLLRGRDGRYRLVWVAVRGEEAYGGLWYAESDDLETWSWPRRLPIPNVPNPQVGPGAGMQGLGGAHAVVYPKLVERVAGVIEAFFTAWHGPEGAGIYRMSTTDGVTWTAPVRLVGRVAIGSLARLPDGALFLAAWTEGNTLALRRIGVDGRVEEVASSGLPPLPTRMGWYQPVIGADPAGKLHLWLPDGPGVWARFVSVDGRTWRGPVDRLEGLRLTDVFPGAGRRVLTVIESCAACYVHQSEREDEE